MKVVDREFVERGGVELGEAVEEGRVCAAEGVDGLGWVCLDAGLAVGGENATLILLRSPAPACRGCRQADPSVGSALHRPRTSLGSAGHPGASWRQPARKLHVPADEVMPRTGIAVS